jgi:hypothetical protein
MTMWLRTASVVALLQGLAHAWLFMTATPRHGQAELDVVESMQSHSFSFGGAMRSYWDFYYGYGLMAAATVFVEAALFWLLASAARANGAAVLPIVVLFIVANLVHAALAWRYFFITPIVPDLIIAALLVGAALAGRLVAG